MGIFITRYPKHLGIILSPQPFDLINIKGDFATLFEIAVAKCYNNYVKVRYYSKLQLQGECKMDKKAIETLAVNAVRSSIVMSNFLDQFIQDNDKEPSWDGHVYIYTHKSKRKDCLKGRLPVPVSYTHLTLPTIA